MIISLKFIKLNTIIKKKKFNFKIKKLKNYKKNYYNLLSKIKLYRYDV